MKHLQFGGEEVECVHNVPAFDDDTIKSYSDFVVQVGRRRSPKLYMDSLQTWFMRISCGRGGQPGCVTLHDTCKKASAPNVTSGKITHENVSVKEVRVRACLMAGRRKEVMSAPTCWERVRMQFSPPSFRYAVVHSIDGDEAYTPLTEEDRWNFSCLRGGPYDINEAVLLSQWIEHALGIESGLREKSAPSKASKKFQIDEEAKIREKARDAILSQEAIFVSAVEAVKQDGEYGSARSRGPRHSLVESVVRNVQLSMATKDLDKSVQDALKQLDQEPTSKPKRKSKSEERLSLLDGVSRLGTSFSSSHRESTCSKEPPEEEMATVIEERKDTTDPDIVNVVIDMKLISESPSRGCLERISGKRASGFGPAFCEEVDKPTVPATLVVTARSLCRPTDWLCVSQK